MEQFTIFVQEGIWRSTVREFTRTTKQITLPIEIRRLITEKRLARDKWQRTRYPSDKAISNRRTRQLNQAITLYEIDNYNIYISSLRTTDKPLWRATKKVLQCKTTPASIRKPDGSLAKNDHEKVELFSSQLKTLFTPRPNILDPEHVRNVEHSFTTLLQLSPPPKAFTPSEVENVIFQLSLRKDPGYNLITPEILPHFLKKSILFLTNLFNAVLRTTYFPAVGKFTKIIMNLKSNKPTNLSSSYRLMGLLPTMRKILEKLLLNACTQS